MKTTIFVSLLLATSALAFPGLTEKEFEGKFHEKFENSELEKEASDELEKEEAEIEKENEAFEKGEANFEEQLQPWDDIPPKEFDAEFTGLKEATIEREYYTGLIWEPNKKNTPEELAELKEFYKDMNVRALPASYDSRALGIVTGVRDQGSCGSCAAFATAANMEICLKKSGSAALDKIDVSEQQLLDCAYDGYQASGCQGATMPAYPNYIKGKKVIHENTYPYTANTYSNNCPNNKAYWNPGSKIDSAVLDFTCNDAKIMHMIQKYGSALMAVYASDNGFKNYKSGVFDTCSYPTNQPNHQVLAVGWGTLNGVPYWLIKNSWGSDYGDKGYIKVKRGTCGTNVECGTVVCSANGTADPAPAAPVVPTVSTCDVSKYFGDVTGTWYLVNDIGGTFREPLCKCAHGKCSPVDTNIKDACTYICGKNPCS